MDLSGVVGGIGYKLYYPLLFFLAYLGITKFKKTSFIYIVYLSACLISILFNNIPSFYKIPFRFSGFVILFIAFTPISTSRYLTIIRAKAIQFFCLFTVGTVVLNFALFKSGAVSQMALQNFEQTGMYTGSTGNNEMGALGGISLIYLSSLLCFKDRIAKKYFYISFALLFCTLAMTLLASSRSAILCAMASILGMLYVKFKNKLGKLLGILCIIIIVGSTISPIFNEYTRGIIEFKQGGNTSKFNTKSRDGLWKLRIQEFSSKPITGIGFGTISNPNKLTMSTGIVETGSSWLTSLSQTGLLGTIPILIIVIGNLWYLLRLKHPDLYKHSL